MNKVVGFAFVGIGAFAAIAFPANAGDKRIKVKVLDRNTSENHYSNVIPAQTNATSNTDVNCSDAGSNINCNGATRTTATTTPARTVGYGVMGAMISLRLPDGALRLSVAIANMR